MATNDGGPAFPRPASEDTSSGTLADGNDVIRHQDGMSLRDWFAGHALAGLLADTNYMDGPADAAEKAFDYADAMLAARAGRTGG